MNKGQYLLTSSIVSDVYIYMNGTVCRVECTYDFLRKYLNRLVVQTDIIGSCVQLRFYCTLQYVIVYH